MMSSLDDDLEPKYSCALLGLNATRMEHEESALRTMEKASIDQRFEHRFARALFDAP